MRRIAASASVLCVLALGAGARSAAADDVVRSASPAPAVPRAAVFTERVSACDPCYEPRRGPLEVRDAFLLAQPRLTLPAMSPDTLGCGRSSLRVGLMWSNTFGWRQSTTGEDPLVRFYMVDGEARTVDATFLHGFTRDLDLGVRVPFHWRGAGFLDDLVDAFHDATFTEDNKRKDFDNDRFRIHGFLEDGSAFDLDQEKGAGLGNVEGIARWRVRDGGRDGTSLALVGRVTAPTGSEPFDTEGVEAGVQVVAARRIGRAFDVYGGIGETVFAEESFQGITYERWRTNVYGAIEWRPLRWASIVYQTEYSTALIGDVVNFVGDHWYMHLGAKIDLPGGAVFELGLTENIINQQTTADFTAFFALEFRW